MSNDTILAVYLRENFSELVVRTSDTIKIGVTINPLNAELNPICHLLALLGAHHILYVSKIRDNICAKIYSVENIKMKMRCKMKRIWMKYKLFVATTFRSRPCSSVGLATELPGWKFGGRIPVVARFSAPVQPGPGAQPASCTMGTESFPWVNNSRA